MRPAHALAILLASAAPARASPGKVMLGPHSGSATVPRLSGVDTAKAAVASRMERDDTAGSRRHDVEAEGTGFAACVGDVTVREGARVRTRRASCSTSTLHMEFGGFSCVNARSDKPAGDGGDLPASGEPGWMSRRTGRLTGRCGACGTQEIENTLRLLCTRAAAAQ